MHLHTKFQDFPSLGSNARAMTEGQTDKRTDGTETITLPAKAGGNDGGPDFYSLNCWLTSPN